MNTKSTTRRRLGALLLSLALIAGLAACDYTSDKTNVRVDARTGLYDGEDAWVEVDVTSKVSKSIYVEIAVDDGTGRPPQSVVFTTSGSHYYATFDTPEIDTSNPGGVDVYAVVWNWSPTTGRGTKIENHSIQDVSFPSA